MEEISRLEMAEARFVAAREIVRTIHAQTGDTAECIEDRIALENAIFELDIGLKMLRQDLVAPGLNPAQGHVEKR